MLQNFFKYKLHVCLFVCLFLFFPENNFSSVLKDLLPYMDFSGGCGEAPAGLNVGFGDIWEAQLVKHLTLDFGSGHDLMVCGMELHVQLWAERGACLRFFLFLCSSPMHTHTLSLPL